ncbi:hypothetical protein LOAG_06060 [Loa loa]|uniref:Uncharacterized protein n=1 Tax=Loa loa TaxID=7209 RepID=A0A1S0TYX7_LOALO|nr:hypothetical protein LOAG_06060 [Loa loa]EFO22425.1 hypothetical protein LOAG_06060 [Loa loa]
MKFETTTNNLFTVGFQQERVIMHKESFAICNFTISGPFEYYTSPALLPREQPTILLQFRNRYEFWSREDIVLPQKTFGLSLYFWTLCKLSLVLKKEWQYSSNPKSYKNKHHQILHRPSTCDVVIPRESPYFLSDNKHDRMGLYSTRVLHPVIRLVELGLWLTLLLYLHIFIPYLHSELSSKGVNQLTFLIDIVSSSKSSFSWYYVLPLFDPLEFSTLYCVIQLVLPVGCHISNISVINGTKFGVLLTELRKFYVLQALTVIILRVGKTPKVITQNFCRTEIKAMKKRSRESIISLTLLLLHIRPLRLCALLKAVIVIVNLTLELCRDISTPGSGRS